MTAIEHEIETILQHKYKDDLILELQEHLMNFYEYSRCGLDLVNDLYDIRNSDSSANIKEKKKE